MQRDAVRMKLFAGLLLLVCAFSLFANALTTNIVGGVMPVYSSPQSWTVFNWALSNSSNESYSLVFSNSSFPAYANATGAIGDFGATTDAGSTFYPYNTTGYNLTGSNGRLLLSSVMVELRTTGATSTSWEVRTTNPPQGCNGTTLASGTISGITGSNALYKVNPNLVLQAGVQYCFFIGSFASGVIRTNNNQNFAGGRKSTAAGGAFWIDLGAAAINANYSFSEVVPVRSLVVTTNTSGGSVNFSSNANISSGVTSMLWANGSGQMGVAYPVNALHLNELWSVSVTGIQPTSASDGFYYPYATSPNAVFNYSSFKPPIGYSFSDCQLRANTHDFNQGDFITGMANGKVFLNNTAVTNTSAVNLSQVIGASDNYVINFTLHTPNPAISYARFLEGGAFQLNCTLVNTTANKLPSLTQGANLFTSTGNNGTNYTIQLSRQEDPTLVINGTNSVTSTQIASVGISVSNGTNTLTNTSAAQGSASVRFLFSQLWDGLTTVVLTATGFNTTNSTTTLSASSATTHQFLSYSMAPAALTMQIFDELTLLPLNATTTITNTTDTNVTGYLQNFSYSYNTIPQGSITITVSNTSYYPRTYFSTLGSASAIVLNVYLVPQSVFSSLVRFHVVGSNSQGISGAQITIRKFISGAWVAVGQQTTDSSGSAAFYMDINTQYEVIAVYGAQSSSLTLIPTSQDYTINLGTTSVIPPTSSFGNLTVDLQPLTFNTSLSSETVSLNVTDLAGTISSFTLSLYFNNGTMFYTNTTPGSPSGGRVPVIVSKAGKEPRVIAYVSVSRSSFPTVAFNRSYVVGTFGNGTYSFNNFVDGVQNSDLSLGARAFLVLFLSILTAAFLSRHTPYGYAGLLAVLAMVFWSGIFGGFAAVILVGGFFGLIWLLFSKYVRGQ